MTPSLLFVDDVVLLTTWSTDLQLSLEGFAVQGEKAGMRTSASKMEAVVLSWKKRWSAHSVLRGGSGGGVQVS